jgi:glycosyltransferase involved in cell wall biosynthesis
MPHHPAILFIHNTYLQKGGEDTVVQQEIEFLKNKGWKVHTLFFSNESVSNPLLRWLNTGSVFFNISAAIQVYRLVKKHRIDIVHVHNFYYRASASVFWGAKAAGARTIFTLHNYRLFCLNGFLFYNQTTCMDCHQQKSFQPGIARKCFKNSGMFSRVLAASTVFHQRIGTWKYKVDQFLVLNLLQKKMLTEQGIDPNKILQKPNFLQETNAAVSYDHREDFFLFAGRMSPEKGIVALIQAVKGKNIPLLLVGDGPLATWVMTQTDTWIQYRPKVEKPVLQELYRKCSGLIFPSIWPEGLPLTVIEAQQAGTVVIAAYSENLKEMISHGENGFLYDPLQNDDLLHCISIFQQMNIKDKNRLSANAYHHFQQFYTIHQHDQLVRKAYQVTENA